MLSRPGQKAALAALVLALCAPGIVRATTIVVNADGSADASTLAGGIALVADGDTVLVAAGAYAGPANRNIDFAGREIRLESIGGPAVTTIDCESAGRAFIFAAGEGPGAVVSGFTVRDGHDDALGGGVFCDGASPVIEDCIFENCVAWDGGSIGQGGGIYCSFSGATIADCTFRGNGAREGAGIYLADSPALVSRSLFVGNTAYRGGGGIRILRAGTTVEDCTFFANTAPVYGGGVYCCYSAPTISHCTFAGNAASEGGAIYGYDAAPMVTDCILSFSSEGAAVYCRGASAFEISYCCIFGNEGGDDACGTAHDNVFANPAFCDTTGGGFQIQECSPCAGAGSGGCDIGAWSVGCACEDTTGVSDAPEDPDAPGDDGVAGIRLTVAPNPTGAGASIAYSWLGERENTVTGRYFSADLDASLGIYTTGGRIVRALTHELRSSNGEVNWDGRDDSGRPVAAGVYLVRLAMNSDERTAKLVVVR